MYQLATCSTCKRIRAELGEQPELTVVDIKTQPLSAAQVDRMAELAGSYEAIFTRRSRQYRARGLHEQELTEADYRRLILDEYTFLKRPVTTVGDRIFVGNAKKTVADLRAALAGATP